MTTPRHLPVLQQLLPPNSYNPNGEHLKVELTATAIVLDELQNSAKRVLNAIDPAKVTELLPEWEAAYGLPDSCDVTPAITINERLGALYAKMVSQLPLTIALLESIAESIGFTGTTVTKRQPATCISLCNTMLNGEAHRFVLDVNSPFEQPVEFANCISLCNAPLAVFEELLLECVFRKLEPAYALFKFHYGA